MIYMTLIALGKYPITKRHCCPRYGKLEAIVSVALTVETKLLTKRKCKQIFKVIRQLVIFRSAAHILGFTIVFINPSNPCT